MDGGFDRSMLNIINTSRYRTCADRAFCRGILYESAVSQQVNFGIVAKISGAGEEKTQPFTGCPLSISIQTGKGRFAPLCPSGAMRQLWMENYVGFVKDSDICTPMRLIYLAQICPLKRICLRKYKSSVVSCVYPCDCTVMEPEP